MAKRAGSILGLAKLERKLKRLPEVALVEIRSAMESVANQIVGLSKSLVPKESGALEKSIGWTWGRPPRGSITLGKVARSALGKQLTITIYAGNDEAFYARWVEFGTAPHSLYPRADESRGKLQGIGDQHPGAAAHPFFFPAYRANRKEAKRKVRAATRRAAKRVAAGG